MPSNIILLQPNGPNGKLEHREPPSPDLVESGERLVQNGYRWLNDTEHGMFMGAWDSTPAIMKSRPFPHHEFMLVLDGSVTIVEPGGHERVFHSGDCFVFPQGSIRQWKQTEYFRKYAVGLRDASWQQPADPNSLRYVPIELDASLERVPALSKEAVESPLPIQHQRKWFADPTGQMNVRVWDSTASQSKPEITHAHEWIHVLEGSVTLTETAGAEHHFKRGDTFIVKLGTIYSWKCPGYFRAIHCTLQPD
jgi:uncharacterized cupin superfamily protein